MRTQPILSGLNAVGRGFKTVGRGVYTGLKYGSDCYDEAESIVFPNRSRVLRFIKSSLAYSFAPIYIPIRRALQKAKK